MKQLFVARWWLDGGTYRGRDYRSVISPTLVTWHPPQFAEAVPDLLIGEPPSRARPALRNQ